MNDEDPELPGSHANREENGFYTGLVLQASSLEEPILKRVELAVEGPTGSLSGRHLQLNFDPAVIRVYRYADGTGEILSGQTLLDIFEVDEIYIRGVGEGSTDLVLTLDQPLNGRPLSDLVVVNVWQ